MLAQIRAVVVVPDLQMATSAAPLRKNLEMEMVTQIVHFSASKTKWRVLFWQQQEKECCFKKRRE